MNSAGNLRRTSSEFGLKRVSLRGRAQLEAHLSKKKQASAAERTFADAKSEKLNTSSASEAIRLAQQGDAEGFEIIYQQHSRRVYALCLRMLRDPVEAQDLTQDVFMQLFRKIHTFRGESAFSTWLLRLAVNLVLMRLRKKSLPMVSIEATPDPDDETASATMDIGAPDLLLDGSLDRINLERCIERLPVGYRTIFVLHDIQGYEHNEISQILGRSVGDSKSQLHKARTRLREHLHELQRDKARDERLAAAKMRSRS